MFISWKILDVQHKLAGGQVNAPAETDVHSSGIVSD